MVVRTMRLEFMERAHERVKVTFSWVIPSEIVGLHCDHG